MKHFFTSIKNSFAPSNDDTPRSTRHAHRKAIAELRSLSDNQLRDIGIDRGSITHCVIHGKPNTNQPKKAA